MASGRSLKNKTETKPVNYLRSSVA